MTFKALLVDGLRSCRVIWERIAVASLALLFVARTPLCACMALCAGK